MSSQIFEEINLEIFFEILKSLLKPNNFEISKAIYLCCGPLGTSVNLIIRQHDSRHDPMSVAVKKLTSDGENKACPQANISASCVKFSLGEWPS